ncbi:MAG TPA: hypothetical protein VF571_05260 [Pyrinomonadaceae bacterium]|jgi:hypothetical protein
MFRKINTFFVIGCLVTLFSTATLVWFWQIQPISVTAQSNAKLTLEVSSDKNSYLQFEPIPLFFKLSNENTIPVKWSGYLAISKNIYFLVRRDGGSENRFHGPESEMIMDWETLQPGKHKEQENLLNQYLGEQIFPQPGRYQVRVEFNYLDSTFGQLQRVKTMSNPITIDIQEPTGNDRQAYNFFKNTFEPVYKRFDQNEMLRLLQQFADNPNFKTTVYWKYIVYDLASIYFDKGENEKAEREFLRVARINFYHSKRVRDGIMEVARKLNRITPADRPAGRLTTLPPDAPIVGPATMPIGPTGRPQGNPPILIPIPSPTGTPF